MRWVKSPASVAPIGYCQLALRGRLVGAVEPLDHGADACAAGVVDRIRGQAEHVSRKLDLRLVGAGQPGEQAALMRGIAVKVIEVAADQGRGVERRNGAAQVVCAAPSIARTDSFM